ncbi:MAG: hypothetical protein LBH28_09810 [Oscillospiraceae bacterium]|nr:hypothetical protein [Oscillospiraceae bacterium]
MMKIRLLIAADDIEYTEHLSNFLSEKYSDTFFVSVCIASERLLELLSAQDFDVALLDTSLIGSTAIGSVRMPLLLWDENEFLSDTCCNFARISKYQRISSIVGEILENYAKVSTPGICLDSDKSSITAIWSPAGGVGKTTVALAYASGKAANGESVLYLNLEHFSSTQAFFANVGKSISSVFEMLEKNEGNLQMLIRGILCHDTGTGVSYFCKPDNFDDMNILSAEDIATLTMSCAGITDELIIDLPCTCDERIRQVFEYADRVLLVTDQTSAAQAKLRQFASQHSVFERIRGKAALIANKGASFAEPFIEVSAFLPFVQSADASAVYKTLSGNLINAWAGEPR